MKNAEQWREQWAREIGGDDEQRREFVRAIQRDALESAARLADERDYCHACSTCTDIAEAVRALATEPQEKP